MYVVRVRFSDATHHIIIICYYNVLYERGHYLWYRHRGGFFETGAGVITS